MSSEQTFLRNGRWLTMTQIKELNAIKHKPTKEEIVENNLEDVVEEGDTIEIPKPKAKKTKTNK